MGLRDEAKFLQSLIYRRVGKAATVLSDVGSLRSIDKLFEAKQAKWRNIGAALTLLGVLGIVGTAMSEGHPAGLAALGIGFVCCLPCWFLMWSASTKNTEDRRYELLEGVLGLLLTDMAPDGRMRVTMDLNKPNLKRKFSHEGKAGHWKVKHYTDLWLQLEGKFVDGTSFLVEVVERFQERSRWARSRSGKMKLKRKTKSATIFRLRLKPKAKRYQHLSELGQDAEEAVQLPSTVETKGVQVEDGGLSLKAQSKQDWKSGEGKQAVAMMFVSLYQILNLSRMMTKA